MTPNVAPPATVGDSPARNAARAAIVLALAFGSYLLLAGAVSAHELIAAAPLGIGIAVLALAWHRARQRSLTLSAPWPHLVGRTGLGLVRDWWAVARRLASLRPIGTGGIAQQASREGGDDPPEAGRRALVTLSTSLPPNGFVLAIEPDRLILHRLAGAPIRDDPEWPS